MTRSTGRSSGSGLLVLPLAAAVLLTAPTVLASRTGPATPEAHHSQPAPPLAAAPATTLATLTAPSPFHPITALDIRISTVRLGHQLPRGVLPIPTLPELGWGGLQPRPAKERSTRQTSAGDDLLATLDRRGGRLLDHTFTPDPGTHRLLDGAGLGFTYDPFGNRAAARPLPAGTSTETLHDWDNRLLGARTEGVATPHTTFRYDPLGRRIAETAGGLTTVRLHWGERVLEEDLLAQDGTPTPRKRLYWGNAIDELAAYDWDGDLDGQLETRLYPLQDEQGTIHAVADADGVLAESYLVRPDGSVQIHGSDRTRPRLVLARLLPQNQGTQRLQLVYSEPTQRTDATTVTITDGQNQPQPLTFTTEQGRVWLAEINPTLMQGGAFTLQLEGVEDLAGNQIDPQTIPFTAPDPAAGIVLPTAAEADVLAVLDGPQQLAIVLGTAVDPASLPTGLVTVRRSGLTVEGSVTVHTGQAHPLDGAVLMWTPTDPAHYQLGPCEVTLGTGLQDLAGHPIHAPPDPIAYDRRGEGDIIWSQLEDAPILSASQVGNDRFLHGRPLIASLGLYDHRARFYDPTTQTFLEPDPLGNVDSPNLYQAFGLDPHNNTDPLGLCTPCARFFQLLHLRDKAAKRLEPVGAAIESGVETVGSAAPVALGLGAVTAVSPPVGVTLTVGLLAKGSVDAGIAHYDQQTSENPYYDRLGESLGVGLGKASGFAIPVQLATGENVDTGQSLTSVEEGQLWGQLGAIAVTAVSTAPVYPVVASGLRSFSLFGDGLVPVRPTLEVSRSRMPSIAANIEDGVAAGAPSTLTRVTARATIRANRRAALRGQPAPPPSQSLDEYPFASSAEGGAGAQVRPVPIQEQHIQGGQLSLFYQRHNLRAGQQFHVRVIP
jgi:RHS repeat-associated protein